MAFSASASFPAYRLIAPDGTRHDCLQAYFADEEALRKYHEIRAQHRRGKIEIWNIRDSSFDGDNYKETRHIEESISLRRLRYIVESNRKLREPVAKSA